MEHGSGPEEPGGPALEAGAREESGQGLRRRAPQAQHLRPARRAGRYLAAHGARVAGQNILNDTGTSRTYSSRQRDHLLYNIYYLNSNSILEKGTFKFVQLQCEKLIRLYLLRRPQEHRRALARGTGATGARKPGPSASGPRGRTWQRTGGSRVNPSEATANSLHPATL